MNCVTLSLNTTNIVQSLQCSVQLIDLFELYMCCCTCSDSIMCDSFNQVL